jgi:uncharacterized protein YxjI
MTRYRLRRGLFGPGPAYDIANQHGWALLVAQPGDPWRDSLVIKDRAGIERATLTRWRLPAGTIYSVTRGVTNVAVISYERGLLLKEVAIRLSGGGEARCVGDLLGAFQIVRGGQALAHVDMGRPSRDGGDYEVTVEPGQSDPLLLAACVAVEALVRRRAGGRLRALLSRAT